MAVISQISAKFSWQDVDFQWKSMTIRDKVEGLRVIPLPPYMGQLLADLPRRNEFISVEAGLRVVHK